MAQEQGLPLGLEIVLSCSWWWSLGDIEVAQERGLPLESICMLECSVWGSFRCAQVLACEWLPMG